MLFINSTWKKWAFRNRASVFEMTWCTSTKSLQDRMLKYKDAVPYQPTYRVLPRNCLRRRRQKLMYRVLQATRTQHARRNWSSPTFYEYKPGHYVTTSRDCFIHSVVSWYRWIVGSLGTLVLYCTRYEYELSSISSTQNRILGVCGL